MFVREKKTDVVVVKVTDNEKKVIEELSRRNGMNMSEYILSLIHTEYMCEGFIGYKI